MGLSLTSALIGLGLVVLGLTLLVIWKRRKLAVLFMIAVKMFFENVRLPSSGGTLRGKPVLLTFLPL